MRTILHSDLNYFYANVECFLNPSIRDKPVVVCGDIESRHGIILTKNPIARRHGVKTGEAVWEAKSKCPNLVTVDAHYDQYIKFSRAVRQIYDEYSDQREDFGIDESWIDCTGSTKLFGSGETIADEIRSRIKNEMGITASIGVSYNKVFAKLGSDYAPPDSIISFTEDNYKELVWKLPVSNLLYVGRATSKKLALLGIKTIGDLANFDAEVLHRHLGVWGIVIYRFANGKDESPVKRTGESSYIKSIGNSITAPRDLISKDDIRKVLYMLSESVSARLRSSHMKCTGIQIHVRDKDLASCDRQMTIKTPTYLTNEIAEKAFEIFEKKYNFTKPVRSIGVRAINLKDANMPYQLDLFHAEEKRMRWEQLEQTIDVCRERFGYNSILKGILLEEPELTHSNIKDEHTIHPSGYFKDGKVI